MTALIIVLIVLVLIIGVLWSTYNGLVKLDEQVNEAWSDITVQLKYRADLIPNVIETVKGYAKHEKEVFEGVTAARSAVMGAKSVKTAAKAESEMTAALSKVFAIAEAYPELKAILTDIGTEELGHLEMIGAIVYQLTKNLTPEEIKKAGGRLLDSIDIFDIYRDIERGKKSMAYALVFKDENKTLTDEEVMEVFNKIIESVENKFNAKLRNM